MVFVVFKCTKCGKITYNECRKREAIATKSYKCYRCGGSSSYKKMKLIRIEENLTEAKRKASTADINEQDISLEDKKSYAKINQNWE